MKIDNTVENDIEQLEAQAKEMASTLDANAQRLSMRTLAQLESGRNKAVARHEEIQGSTVNADGTLSHWASWAGHHRGALMGLAFAAIFGAFMMLQMFDANETSDAFLLGADLPPEAFVDQGFEPSLNSHTDI